jgi:ABC-type lipoprotein release transport system permease subunit
MKRIAEIFIGITFLVLGIYNAYLRVILIQRILRCMESILCSSTAYWQGIDLEALLQQAYIEFFIYLLLIATGLLIIVPMLIRIAGKLSTVIKKMRK